MKTIQEFEERLSEVRSEMYDIEENTSRYYELGEWRIEGYDNEARFELLQDLEERLMAKLSELEDEAIDE